MKHRNVMTQAERNARSKLAKLVHEKTFLKGSIVSMARTCGKKGCKCTTRGEKHVSMYLSVSTEGKSKMIYIPASLEATVKAWIQTGKEIQDLTRQVEEAGLKRLLKRKKKVIRKTSGPGNPHNK